MISLKLLKLLCQLFLQRKSSVIRNLNAPVIKIDFIHNCRIPRIFGLMCRISVLFFNFFSPFFDSFSFFFRFIKLFFLVYFLEYNTYCFYWCCIIIYYTIFCFYYCYYSLVFIILLLLLLQLYEICQSQKFYTSENFSALKKNQSWWKFGLQHTWSSLKIGVDQIRLSSVYIEIK